MVHICIVSSARVESFINTPPWPRIDSVVCAGLFVNSRRRAATVGVACSTGGAGNGAPAKSSNLDENSGRFVAAPSSLIAKRFVVAASTKFCSGVMNGVIIVGPQRRQLCQPTAIEMFLSNHVQWHYLANRVTSIHLENQSASASDSSAQSNQ